MSLTFRKLHPRFAAEVGRIELRQVHDPETLAEIRAGMVPGVDDQGKAEVAALTRYVAPLEGRRALLRLDFNESTVGPSSAVVEAVRDVMGPR